MSPPDFIPPHLLPTAQSLGENLIERLTSIRDYNPELGALISLLCIRIGHGDGHARRELWCLAQGLHYGGAFSAGNLDRLKLQMSLLPGGEQ